MKIILVTEYLAPENRPYFGGTNARTINFAKQLVKKNDVHIITTLTDGGKENEDYEGVNIHRIGKKRTYSQRGEFSQRYQFNAEVASEISKLHPDVVDGSGFVSWHGCYKGSKKIGIPVIATVHEVWQGDWVKNTGLISGVAGHFLEKTFLNYKFDKYIAVSNFTKEKLIQKLGISHEKIAMVYNGIDLKQYNAIKVKKKYQNPTIVTICRLVHYKRVDDLLRALQILKADIPDVKLQIIGSGPEENHLKCLSKDLGIEDDVTFLGKFAKNDDVIRTLKMSHIFALPSIVEGFGMVVLEAMAAGTPYVASDIPPIREVTNGGIGGLLFKPTDYHELASKLRTLLNDEAQQKNSRKTSYVTRKNTGNDPGCNRHRRAETR